MNEAKLAAKVKCWAHEVSPHLNIIEARAVYDTYLCNALIVVRDTRTGKMHCKAFEGTYRVRSWLENLENNP